LHSIGADRAEIWLDSTGPEIGAGADDGRATSTIPLQQFGRAHVAGDINGSGLPIVVSTGDGSIQPSQL
jgi:hypothetical protein